MHEASSTMISQNTSEVTRVWTPTQIWWASFLSGPIGGCYFLGQNYKTLGKKAYFKKSLMMGAIASLLLSTLAFFDLPKWIPWYLPLLLQALVTRDVAVRSQGVKIKEILGAGGKKNSSFKLLYITALFALLQLIAAFGVAYILLLFGVPLPN